jgi:hypothetical protein
MTTPSLNRRNFLRMGAVLPIASAVLPSIANSAFAAVPSAGVPAVGYIDVPPNVALLNINEYPSGPTPAAVEIMHKMAANGNRYYMAETAKFGKELAVYYDLKPDYLSIYAGSSEILHSSLSPLPRPQNLSSPPTPNIRTGVVLTGRDTVHTLVLAQFSRSASLSVIDFDERCY